MANVKYHLYADDIKIYVETFIHHDLLILGANNIRKWLVHNYALVNSKLCVYIFIFLILLYQQIISCITIYKLINRFKNVYKLISIIYFKSPIIHIDS